MNWVNLWVVENRCKCLSLYISAELYGDPHFGTLDGKQFTFNGKGEYTMLRVNTSTQNFELQARTGQATQADGTTLDATVFMAFAGKDVTGNTSFHVELSHDRTSMILRRLLQVAYFSVVPLWLLECRLISYEAMEGCTIQIIMIINIAKQLCTWQ